MAVAGCGGGSSGRFSAETKELAVVINGRHPSFPRASEYALSEGRGKLPHRSNDLPPPLPRNSLHSHASHQTKPETQISPRLRRTRLQHQIPPPNRHTTPPPSHHSIITNTTPAPSHRHQPPPLPPFLPTSYLTVWSSDTVANSSLSREGSIAAAVTLPRCERMAVL